MIISSNLAVISACCQESCDEKWRDWKISFKGGICRADSHLCAPCTCVSEWVLCSCAAEGATNSGWRVLFQNWDLYDCLVLFGLASHSIKAFMSNLRTLLCDSFLLLLGAGRICDGGSKLNTPGAGESMILVLESSLRNLWNASCSC